MINLSMLPKADKKKIQVDEFIVSKLLQGGARRVWQGATSCSLDVLYRRGVAAMRGLRSGRGGKLLFFC